MDAPPVPPRLLAGGQVPIPHLVRGGLPVLLSQTFRGSIHSRLEMGLRGDASSHPGVDILLFEPDHHDPALFLANTFDCSQRRRLAEHAYQHTRRHLRSQRGVTNRALARHKLVLHSAVLDQPGRRLLRPLRSVRSSAPRRGTPAGLALQRLDETLSDLQRLLEQPHDMALKPGR